MTIESIYAPQRNITDINKCWFYHVTELPGHGVVPGPWDLRKGVDTYLGNVNVSGKRVLDVGTASGFLCFEMEKRGAEVVGYDVSEHETWDIVPFGGSIQEDKSRRVKKLIESLNNGWWLAHNLLNSKARVVYGSVYDIPVEIGQVDISIYGCILLHLRDPFLALQKGAALTAETIVVTDLIWPPGETAYDKIPDLSFYPDPDQVKPDQEETWWHFSPKTITRYLKILGFNNFKVSFHKQIHHSNNQPSEIQLFTVVGNRH
jgi:SAM-dependent methyltransferase